MSTRRIESPRYGMVVTDGIAGRVFMLLRRTYEEAAGDEVFVWEALRIAAPGSRLRHVTQRARVLLAPGEFAEVVPDDGKYEFVGGPLDGRREWTTGAASWQVDVAPPLVPVFYGDSLSEEPIMVERVGYELRRDGRYHVAGGV